MTSKPVAYNPPDFENEIRLQLSRNESGCAIDPLSEYLGRIPSQLVSRYPSQLELQQLLGAEHHVEPERIVVSAGGDESLDRAIRLALQNRSEIINHSPSFEMVEIYTRNHGGTVKHVAWFDGEFPTDDLIARINSNTGLIILVSPNNPTGKTIPVADILKIARQAVDNDCRVLVDLAYVEFADEDPTPTLIDQPNILVLRTFSKAWGLAGLRVGYLITPDIETGNLFRAAAGPFPVSGLSVAAASHCLVHCRDAMQANVDRIKQIRDRLVQLLLQVGGKPVVGQGNFVLCQFDDANDLWNRLVDDGVGVRKFLRSESLQNCLRITCPVTAADWHSLVKALARTSDSEIDLEPFLAIDDSINPPPETVVQDDPRTAILKRQTKETNIDIELNLDGTGQAEISTGIGFLDHMLTALAFHSRMDLKLICTGDLHIDDHHTAEDCALALGTAIDGALGPRRGIIRFGYAYAPLDEALARTVLDLSGRPWPEIKLGLQREMLGTIATENLTHVFQSLAMAMKCSLHVDVIRGENDHHRAEAAFKSLALALRSAITRTIDDVPSTKGVIA